MGRIIKRNDNGEYPFQEWITGEEKPAVHPVGAITEKRKEEREQGLINSTARSLKRYQKGVLTEDDLNSCLQINSEALGMGPDDLLDIANQWLSLEEDGNE